MDRLGLVVSLVACLPILGILGFALPGHAHMLTSPCVEFGAGTSGSGSMTPDDPCARGFTSVSGSRLAWLGIVALIDGGLLLALGLALVGGARRRPGLHALAAAIVLPAATPLMLGFGGVVVLVAVPLLLGAARVVGPPTGWALVLARAVGTLLAVAALAAVAMSLIEPRIETLPFFAIALAVGAGSAAAAWWPARRAAPLS